MTELRPELDHDAAKALIAEIGLAFDGVKRTGAISWREAEAIDGWESAENRARAREFDRDTHWNQLVEDPEWQPFPGWGGFAFIDANGFHYYLPPTMIRFINGNAGEWYPGQLLSSIDRFVVDGDQTWTTAQLAAIARFVEFMAANDPDEDGRHEWETALRSRWAAHLRTAGQ